MESELTSDDDVRLQSIRQSHNDQDTPTMSLTANDEEWDTKEGWPVVTAGSAIFFVYLGLVYSYGIVQLHLSEAHLASVSTLSFIGSVGAAMSPLTGMIVARVIKLTGYRVTALMGSILLGLGEFTAGWSTKSVPAMFVTQGFVFGIGSALLFLVRKYCARLCLYGLRISSYCMLIKFAASSHGAVVVVQAKARACDWYCLWRRGNRIRGYIAFSGEADWGCWTGIGFEDSWGCSLGDLHPSIVLFESTRGAWPCRVKYSMVRLLTRAFNVVMPRIYVVSDW